MHSNFVPINAPLLRPPPGQKLYAENIATAMEMLTAGWDLEIIVLQTGVNHIHMMIAEQFGFDVYPPFGDKKG